MELVVLRLLQYQDPSGSHPCEKESPLLRNIHCHAGLLVDQEQAN